MTKWWMGAVASVALLSSGCNAQHYCMVQQDYQKAAVVPELQPTEGLNLPQSASALRMPPQPENGVPFGTKGDSGVNVCLDQPPRMKAVKPKETTKS